MKKGTLTRSLLIVLALLCLVGCASTCKTCCYEHALNMYSQDDNPDARKSRGLLAIRLAECRVKCMEIK